MSDTRVIAATIAAVAALGLASFAWIYGGDLALGDPIRSDGIGYYIYLPAVALDHDVTMERTAERSFAGRPADMQGVRRAPPHDHYLDQFPVGEALMLAPFFAAGHALALIAGEDTAGWSWPYQAAAAAAGFTYLLVGLAVLAATLRRLFGLGTVVVTLLAITFGTDLFHYGTYDATFSHAFSFALVASIVALTVAVHDRPRAATALALGAALGLLTVVRPTNLVVLVFCALYGVRSLRGVRDRAVALARRVELVALGCGAFLLLLTPQIAYWEAVTGKPFVNGYKSDQRLDLLDPHLTEILFGVRKGLFFWTPLLLLAVAGLPYLRRYAPGWFLPAIVYLALHTWVVASWSVWWYGGSFGMRPFAEALPIFAPGLAALLEAARSVRARRLVRAGLGVTTLLSVHAMLAYWTGHVPFDGTTLHDYLRSFRYV